MLLRVPLVCAWTSACNWLREAAQAGSALQVGLEFSAFSSGLAQATVFATSTMFALRASPSARMRPTSLAVLSRSLSVLSPPISCFIVVSTLTSVPALPTA
uniref:Uncharacterized protein n=1 Tax=Mycobacterium kansasii TaxID=1768 RepID=A0A653EX62_MYCKA|nr:hypothetical protein BIN_B_02856 [Mycobacterium kansasii]